MIALIFAFSGIAAYWLLVVVYHFSTAMLARRCGVAVEEITIGFGSSLIVHQRGSETWRFKLFPIGGYTTFRSKTTDAKETDGPEPLAGSLEAAPTASQLMIVAVGPLTNLLAGMLLLGVAVWHGDNQLGAAPASPDGVLPTRARGLAIKQETSSWEGQLRLVVGTSGFYLWRLVTFRSLEGWGGPLAFFVTLGRVGQDSALNWVTLMGATALTMGCFDLLPLPSLNGYQLLHITAAAMCGRRRLPEAIYLPPFYLGLLVLLIWLVRILWLDCGWVWRNVLGG